MMASFIISELIHEKLNSGLSHISLPAKEQSEQGIVLVVVCLFEVAKSKNYFCPTHKN